MLAERLGSHFSRKGQINLISWPDCYIFKNASVDTHIEATYVCHLSSLTSAGRWWVCGKFMNYLNAGTNWALEPTEPLGQLKPQTILTLEQFESIKPWC